MANVIIKKYASTGFTFKRGNEPIRIIMQRKVDIDISHLPEVRILVDGANPLIFAYSDSFNINGVPVYGSIEYIVEYLMANVFNFFFSAVTDNGSNFIELTAGQNLSSGRAVIKDAGKVYYFDPNESSHASKLVGITKTSGITDGIVEVQFAGVMEDAAFSFSLPERSVFIGLNGQLQSTVPVDKTVIQSVGQALFANKLLINFYSPTIRNN